MAARSELLKVPGADEIVSQPEKDIVDAMKKCFFEHTPPPVCLGSKSGNLGHRFQAMVHSLSLLCNGGAALESFIKSLKGICSACLSFRPTVTKDHDQCLNASLLPDHFAVLATQ